ncbi:alpha/beta hydrolase-fold protein [Asaia astilbis]|uniref:alpha/beta hydrolase-fold protein n=1 Tax=Asaia astilbis TaxID=610244 RepID=UPI00046EC437|nr:alpha/beta hydrolase-fold protein [Asaia astilbis]
MSSDDLTFKHYPAPAGDNRGRILVLLCGVGIHPADFETEGFIEQLHGADSFLDIWAIAPAPDLYFENRVGEYLQATFLSQFSGRELHLLGISLGAMGALCCAACDSSALKGLILLAPFLGTQGTMEAIASRGGLATWKSDDVKLTPIEKTSLLWLRERLNSATGVPLYLGHARDDRFKAGHQLLARDLPEDRVVEVSGGHDWDAWRAQLDGILTRWPR